MSDLDIVAETTEDVADEAPPEPPSEPPLASPPVDRLAAVSAVTGLLLVVLLGLHLTTLVLRSPEQVDVPFLIGRWDNPLWLFVDWSMLLVGTVHALVASGRRAHQASRGTAMVAFAVLAAFTVATFVAASWAMMRLI